MRLSGMSWRAVCETGPTKKLCVLDSDSTMRRAQWGLEGRTTDRESEQTTRFSFSDASLLLECPIAEGSGSAQKNGIEQRRIPAEYCSQSWM